MAEKPDSGALKNQNAAIIDEFRANGGKVGGPFDGATLLLLTTTGAKSGQQRVNPVMYFPVDGKVFVVGSYAGADVDPAWVHNLRANPSAHIEKGTDAYDVMARELPRAEQWLRTIQQGIEEKLLARRSAYGDKESTIR